MTPSGPAAAGVQAERTLLAWGRTCLSIGAAGVAVLRLDLGALGPVAAVVGSAASLLAAAAYAGARHRYRIARAGARLVAPSPALAVVLVSAAVCALALLALAWTTTRG